MNTIKLKNISLKNFKGIQEFSIELNDTTSSIFGANGTGKTTLFDAFTWLLFGKDSTDKKDFQIKTLDASNTVIPKIEHEVSAEIIVDGKTISLRRLLTEKWAKSRGKETAEFTGNQTTFFWNDLEMGAKEFQSKVGEILDESVFKLITSPFAFHKLHWSERRKVLTEIAGDVSDEELAAGNEKFQIMLSNCQSNGTTIDERKRQLSGSIKTLSADMSTIPSRIDEVRRNMPQMIDETEVNNQIAEKQVEIEKIDKQLRSRVEANMEVNKKITDNQNKIFELKSEMNAIEFAAKEEAKNKVRELTSGTDAVKAELDHIEEVGEKLYLKSKSIEEEINSDKVQLANHTKTKEGLLAEWYKINDRKFDATASKCPCCNQDVPADEAKFIADKKQSLSNINEEGKLVASKIETLTKNIKQNEAALAEVKEKHAAALKSYTELDLQYKSSNTTAVPTYEEIYDKIILDSVKFSKLRMEIAALEANKFEVPADDSELRNTRNQFFNEIIELKESIAGNKHIEQYEQRLNELKAEETALSQKIAKLEKELFIIENFTKEKMDAVEKKVNGKFQIVRFKMFDVQVNGAQAETCEILINGVPFADANTASKINAGVDIINTLSQYYQTSAPIFIDNRESVSELIETPSQVINLIVSPEHKSLTLK